MSDIVNVGGWSLFVIVKKRVRVHYRQPEYFCHPSDLRHNIRQPPSIFWTSVLSDAAEVVRLNAYSGPEAFKTKGRNFSQPSLLRRK